MSLLLSGGTGISLERFEGGALPETTTVNTAESLTEPLLGPIRDTAVPHTVSSQPYQPESVHHHHDKYNHETKKFYSKLQRGIIGLYLLLILIIMIWFSATLDKNVITQTGTLLSIVGFIIYVMFEVFKYRTFVKKD